MCVKRYTKLLKELISLWPHCRLVAWLVNLHYLFIPFYSKWVLMNLKTEMEGKMVGHKEGREGGRN